MYFIQHYFIYHPSALRFHCVVGCWDRTQDCCDFGIGSQTLELLGLISSTIHLQSCYSKSFYHNLKFSFVMPVMKV
jgi:hypothetical protein